MCVSIRVYVYNNIMYMYVWAQAQSTHA